MKYVKTFELFGFGKKSKDKLNFDYLPDSEMLYDWDKNFDVGDDVFYLGHDGVGGYWHGYKYPATQEIVDNKEESKFYRLVGVKIEHEDFRKNANLKKQQQEKEWQEKQKYYIPR